MTGDLQGEKRGIQAAVAALHDPAVPPVMPAEQLPLLPIREVGADLAAEKEAARRGVGRPKGSINRSTEEWKNFILSQYRSPLIALAEIYSRPISELAKDLGKIGSLTFAEARDLLQLQLQCAKELAPYVHQKQPLAIDNKGESLMTLVIGALPQQENHPQNASPYTLEMEPLPLQENQQLSNADFVELNETELNETAAIKANSRADESSARDSESFTVEGKQ
jgi:hypothetical protein